MTTTVVLADQLGLEFEPHIDPQKIDYELASQISIGYAKTEGILPVYREGDAIVAAVSDPLNHEAIEALRLLFGCPIKVFVTTPAEIIESINTVFDRAAASAEDMGEELESIDVDEADLNGEILDIIEMRGDEAPIIRYVNRLLHRAVKQRASDIHIEPFEDELSVRFRIDGVLYEVEKRKKNLHAPIVSRIKIMAKLNIAEKRLPQDGRIRVKIAGKDIDIRVSVIPTAHGERVAMRLLDRSRVLLQLEELGLGTDHLEMVNRLIHKSHGIILVTGPTGSGKTTTLYAALMKLNSPDKNILTVEDPIEYQIKGIGQMQVNPKINLTFANALRSFLRQDPDIILVGEIRDTETADLAIHASLTGHLVLSTLHTTDAPGAITRLLDMGVEPYLVSSSLIGVIAQRLVRVVCPHCRKPYRPLPKELEELGITAEEVGDSPFYSAAGCDECMGTGYLGRTAIFEILLVTDPVRRLILDRADSTTIKREAIKQGMRTLRQDGARKVCQGITTAEEVLRVTQEEVI
ncbi:MAG TPA: type II secretion system protein GspE [Proteobacteria bacterium]|nr:type II secretion system protein GspE [Pseudomonadota bacterium]